MAVQIIRMPKWPRGDSGTIPFEVPKTIWTAGCSIFFAVKPRIEDDRLDQTAVIRRTLTDADIIAQDADKVTYVVVLAPGDTNTLDLGKYVAEFQYVSADKQTVLSYPHPSLATLEFELAGDVNRRTV